MQTVRAKFQQIFLSKGSLYAVLSYLFHHRIFLAWEEKIFKPYHRRTSRPCNSTFPHHNKTIWLNRHVPEFILPKQAKADYLANFPQAEG